jgi:dimethylargininase
MRAFTKAIVRPPGLSFSSGLTTAGLGPPNLARAREQHDEYCDALERCGLSLIHLEAEPLLPDSPFVEDTAILTERAAILTRPGARSRRGEVASIRKALERQPLRIRSIEEPGTLDGGDVCETDGHFLIGLSERTNEEGARQLARFLIEDGLASTSVDIRDLGGLLHLKSGIAFLGCGRFVTVDALARHGALRGNEIITVDPKETYAANCVRVNEFVLIAAGSPRLEAHLKRLGQRVIAVEMSEFQKMDGGLSCLSLRF